jgi:hypothetical protein
VCAAQAEFHRADLPPGQVEQPWIARQAALRRAVVEVGEFVDDRGDRRVRGGILEAGAVRTRHPAVEQRSPEQQAMRLRPTVDVLGQVVAPIDVNMLVQSARPGGGQPLDRVSKNLMRRCCLGWCQ